MKKHIAEELPTRSHPPAALSSQANKSSSSSIGNKGGGDRKEGSGAEKSPEQRIRQAVYDIRYRARRENLPLRTAYSQYMQNSSMSEMEKAEVRNKLFGKEGTSGGSVPDQKNNEGSSSSVRSENFEFIIKETASSAVANALYKVFVDKQPNLNEEYIEELKKSFQKSSETPEGKKFKIRVYDPQSNVSYVRYANREKISQLRARGLHVEMTEYGDAYEGERERGEQTAEVSRERSRANKDYDGDGKVESGAKEHAGVVHNAIQRKKGLPADGKDTSNVKESYIGEVLGMANLPILDDGKYANLDANQKQIDVLPPDKKNKVTVNPTNSLMAHNVLNGNILIENGYSKFLSLLKEKKMSATKEAKDSMKEECDDKESNGPKNLDRDAIEQRGMETAMNRIKNKFRSMGAKRVMIAPDAL
jgi:hypothetical protein